MSRSVDSLGHRFVAVLAAAMLPLIHVANAQTSDKPEAVAPYAATLTLVVDAMLKLADVGPNDFVVDLGSGDGRIVIAAATRFRARGGLGVDIEPKLVKYANDSAAQAGIADRVTFREEDLYKTDVREASVVTVYLLPAAMPRLEQKLLAELKPGTRVVVQDYPFPTWRAERVIELRTPDKETSVGTPFAQLFLYKVPATK
ncbi:MAG TPA: methyltransferase domain-containing protein [Casimicrobiaceae bacterium]|jgi:protein-L-isoaspartate O-methyltransferase